MGVNARQQLRACSDPAQPHARRDGFGQTAHQHPEIRQIAVQRWTVGQRSVDIVFDHPDPMAPSDPGNLLFALDPHQR